MGTCCCKDNYDSEWYYSRESLPPLDIEAKIEWTNTTPYNSPLSDKESGDLYLGEYLYQNRYRM